MPDRVKYDLSHLCFMSGEMQRVQTLLAMPVVAGDSIVANLAGVLRFAPLRRDIVLDAIMDIAMWFVPNRHIYSNWIDFIKEGIMEDEALATDSVSSTNPIKCLGYNQVTGTTPQWLTRGYLQIWQRYYRVVDDRTNEAVASSTFSTDRRIRTYGYPAARLKSLPSTGRDLNTGLLSTTGVNVDVGGTDTFSILELGRRKQAYRSSLKRAWNAQRYTDVLRELYGGAAGEDADVRPTLLMRTNSWLSGYDVDGTGDASLGQFSGKVAGIIDVRMPRRFFPEHGTLWCTATVRFPNVWYEESHYLVQHANASYKEISGDPHLISVQEPHELLQSDLFDGGDSSPLGTHPYGQWYRYHPNIAHSNFQALKGYPFIAGKPSHTGSGLSRTAWYSNPANEYSPIFQTTNLAHWRSQARWNIQADRVVPSVGKSIFAGTT